MASLSKYDKRSPYYYVAFTSPSGKRLKKSTGQRSRAKALEVARTWERAATLVKERTLTEARIREFLSKELKSVTGEGLRTFTVRQWFDHFCKIKADSQDPDTAAKYEQIKREFLDFLGPKADLDILAITSADVRAFRDHRKKSGITATTLNDHLTILSSYFNGAWRDHVISNNPCTAVEPARDNVSPAKRQKQPFTVEQMQALLHHAKGDWPGLIRTAFYTGARLENCANLRFRNLDFNSEPPIIVFENYSKHGDEHKVPMHPALKDYLLSIKKKRGQLRKTGKIIELPTTKGDNEFLFLSLAGRRVANLSKQFRKLMEAARIRNWKVREGVKGKGRGAARDVWALGFHSFRRTNVSIMANKGVPEEQRMAITAHATRDVHQDYTHHQLEQLQKAVALLPTL
jgi:integrase